MKNFSIIILFILALSTSAFAINTTQTVEQVSSAIILSENVDYHITSTTPFTASGSIDVTNTDQAVIIFDNLKPSLALKQLGFVKINGEAAVNGTNCQVRIYNRGAIIYPFGNDFKPLTAYTEPNFGGESCNDYTLGSSGGFMKTLNATTLNNRIRSFKLHRGYMVTFAIKNGGYGYSRCFIADKEDIEFAVLPAVLDHRISSYRIFKWNDVGKAGLANDTRAESNDLLNTSWCYTFGVGEDRGPDHETVAHHIHEGWPAINSCGLPEYSAHMKTNNEPANSADDAACDVAAVLANWETLMATGKRLCSPSQHDGGLNWTQEFFDSIDARGWRCDIVDIHCYWPEWNLNNQVEGYWNKYKRPVWISEYIWGASWNKNGVFASSNPDVDNLTVMSKVHRYWNSCPFIERYAYWNSESKGHIYENGKLTPLGEDFAKMNTGLAYNSAYTYVPRNPRVTSASGLTATYRISNNVCELKWSDNNGDLIDSMFVERKRNDGEWERLATMPLNESNSSYSLKDTVAVSGSYVYRIHTITFNGLHRYSNEAYNTLGGTEGTDQLQYGTMTAYNTDDSYSFFCEQFPEDKKPVVIMGSPTMTNRDVTPVEHVYQLTKLRGAGYSIFRFAYFPLSLGEKKTFDAGAESSNYIVAADTTGTIGNLNWEAGYVSTAKVKVVDDVVSYTFAQPFASTPAVFVTPLTTSVTYPVTARVFDVTPEGFKVCLQREYGLNSVKISADVAFFAIDKGQGMDDNGKLFVVGDTLITLKGESRVAKLSLPSNLTNAKLMLASQTMNSPLMYLWRVYNDHSDRGYYNLRFSPDKSNTDYTVSSSKPLTDNVAWLTISDDQMLPTSIFEVPNIEAIGRADGRIYNMRGQYVGSSLSSLPAGVYIQNGRKIVK